MSEKDLIQKLNTLKSIKLDENWKNKDKSGFLALASKNTEKVEFMSMFNWNWLFQPVPKMVLASFTVLLVVGSLMLSFLMLGNDFYGELPEIAQYDNKEIGNNKEGELANKEINREAENNKEISSSIDSSVLIGRNPYKSVSIDLFASMDNEEDLLRAFRTDLMAKVNRVWVLALESGNDEAFAVAQEAEKFYGEKDYDAALRAIGVAEDMLEKD